MFFPFPSNSPLAVWKQIAIFLPVTEFPAFLLAQGNPSPGLLGNPLVMIVLMIIMFYFLLIRPQKKQRQEQEARVAALKKGDKVVTIGGMHGIVHAISPETVTLKLSEGVFVPFNKSAIATTSSKPGKPIKDDKTGEKSGDSKEEKV